MGCGNKLIAPKLQEGHKVYKTKALYVRPSRTILVSLLFLIAFSYTTNVGMKMEIKAFRTTLFESYHYKCRMC